MASRRIIPMSFGRNSWIRQVLSYQMLPDVMNMLKEADEFVCDCISRIHYKLNRFDALLSERNINISALLRNCMFYYRCVSTTQLCKSSYFWLKSYPPND